MAKEFLYFRLFFSTEFFNTARGGDILHKAAFIGYNVSKWRGEQAIEEANAAAINLAAHFSAEFDDSRLPTIGESSDEETSSISSVDEMAEMFVIGGETSDVRYIQFQLAEGQNLGEGHFEVRGEGPGMSWEEGIKCENFEGDLCASLPEGEYEFKLAFVPSDGSEMKWQQGENIRFSNSEMPDSFTNIRF